MSGRRRRGNGAAACPAGSWADVGPAGQVAFVNVTSDSYRVGEEWEEWEVFGVRGWGRPVFMYGRPYYRPAGWRWRLGWQLSEPFDPSDPDRLPIDVRGRARFRRDGVIDEWVERVARFAKGVRRGKSPVRADPAVEAARQFRLTAGRRDQVLLQAWLLTGVPLARVAEETGRTVELAGAYLACFFGYGELSRAPSFVAYHIARLHRREPWTFEEAEHAVWLFDAACDGERGLRWLLEAASIALPDDAGPGAGEPLDEAISRGLAYRTYVASRTTLWDLDGVRAFRSLCRKLVKRVRDEKKSRRRADPATREAVAETAKVAANFGLRTTGGPVPPDVGTV